MACYSPTKIKDDLICPICFEDYDLKRIPKMLDCNHTFCGQCLEASKTTLCGGLPQVQLQDQVLVPGSLKCAICRSVYLNVNIDELLENYVITDHLKKTEEEKDREIAFQLHIELNEREVLASSELKVKNKSYFSGLWSRKIVKEDTRNEENESKIRKRSRISKIKDAGIFVSKYNLRAKKFKTDDKEAVATSTNYIPGECGEKLKSETEAEAKPKKTPAKKAVKTPAKKIASKAPVKKKTANKAPSKRGDQEATLIKKTKTAPTPKICPAKKAVKAPAKKVTSKTPAKKVASKTPAKKTPAKKTPAKKTPAKKTPSKRSVEKVVDSDSSDDNEPLINYYLLHH